MKLFYMSTAMPDYTYEHIVQNCRRFKPTYSGIGFDRNVAEGMRKFAEITAVSLAPVPSFPKYKNLVWRGRSEKQVGICYHIPAMVNLPILKELWFVFSATKRLIRWCREHKDNRVVLISGVFRCYILTAAIAQIFFGIKLYAIVPDVPEVMSTYRKDYSKLRQILNRFEIRFGKYFRSFVDGFILLTPHMNSLINSKGVPWIVVDGMVKVPECFANTISKQGDDIKRTILYAGKLSSQFGIDKLIAAFLEAKTENCELLIYGDGDYVHEVEKISVANKNVIYGGVVPHEVILRKEQEADLLVDPRPSDSLVSKMAFPSKIIEYMASGTPVLTTALPCFDKVYEKYQYRFFSEDIPSMADKIREIMSLDKEELKRFGKQAREFILREKTIEKQCEKIFLFIESLQQV